MSSSVSAFAQWPAGMGASSVTSLCVRPLTIDLWCNFVAGGWSPLDLESGLGGSEECIVLWSAALAARGHRVTVYHNPPRALDGVEHRGVSYRPHFRFDPDAPRDALVTWKSPHPWALGAKAPRRIHWSSDVERPWPARVQKTLDAFVCLTPYHRSTMPWLPEALAQVVPHGIDLGQLDQFRHVKIPGRALYASSPDRGLLTLLRDWPRIRLEHPGLSLEIVYGWQRFIACQAGHLEARVFRAAMERLMGQEGITWRGQVSRAEMAAAYWQAEYWLHPLNRAESELFCLNALKARHCGALAVVNRIGALWDTVTRWIDYPRFVRGDGAIEEAEPCPTLGWDEVVARYWEPLLQG